MTRRFILATVAGALTIAVLGGLLYGVVFARLFRANMGSAVGVLKRPPDFAWIGLSHVPFSILLVLVISWRGVLTAKGGAMAGGILGFLMAASYDLAQYGTANLWTLKLTLIEPFITMVMVAGAGAVVGAVLSRQPRTSGVAR